MLEETVLFESKDGFYRRSLILFVGHKGFSFYIFPPYYFQEACGNFVLQLPSPFHVQARKADFTPGCLFVAPACAQPFYQPEGNVTSPPATTGSSY